MIFAGFWTPQDRSIVSGETWNVGRGISVASQCCVNDRMLWHILRRETIAAPAIWMLYLAILINYSVLIFLPRNFIETFPFHYC